MPKLTKKSTKAKSSKKPSKLQIAYKKLNLARPRNQFIAVFLMVGILGGGYFTYQSFAAVTHSWGFVDLKCVTAVPICKGASDSVTGDQKNLTSVFELTKGGAIAPINGWLTFPVNTPHKLCVDAKGTGFISLSKIKISNPFDLDVYTNVAITDGASYKRYCGDWVTQLGTPGTSFNTGVFVNHLGGNPIRISNMSVENQSTFNVTQPTK